MNEKEIIEQIQSLQPSPSSRVFIGIGDDAAVTTPPSLALVSTTDTLVEDVHFRFELTSLRELGWRAIAVNLSDLAAQGAKPLYILLSLTLPKRVTREAIHEFYSGILDCTRTFGCELIGGNLTSSDGPVVINVTALGEPFTTLDKIPQRGTMSAGDWLAVTGPLGMAAAGLQVLQARGRSAVEAFPLTTQRYLRPVPRVNESKALVQTGAVTSMMDISDGLLLDLTRLRRGFSGQAPVQFVLEESSFYPGRELTAITRELSLAPEQTRQWQFSGGDDYELLLTLDPYKWNQAVEQDLSLKDLVHIIGEVEAAPPTAESHLYLRQQDNVLISLTPKGWDHF